MRYAKPFYGLVLVVMLIAIIAQYLASPLANAYAPTRGATLAQALQELLRISMVLHPVPAMFRADLPHLVTAVLYWLQIALFVRRISLCIRGGTIVTPSSFLGGWGILFAIGLLSWIAGTLTSLLPIVLRPIGVVWVVSIPIAMSASALFVPAANIFGVTFFVVELLSIKYDGLLPSTRISTEPAGEKPDAKTTTPSARFHIKSEPRHVFMRRAAKIGVTIGVALVVVPPIWNVYATGLIYRYLCETRAGEHIFEKARATSILFVGESPSMGLIGALQDVAERRFDFIEVVKDPENFRQMDTFFSLFGTRDPKGIIFRISIGPANSASCMRSGNYYGMRETLPADECLQYVGIEKAVSRYRVEAEYKRTTWLTPFLHSDNTRIIDSEKSKIMSEDLNLHFTKTGTLGLGTQTECPSRHGRAPAGLHRKVLLGME